MILELGEILSKLVCSSIRQSFDTIDEMHKAVEIRMAEPGVIKSMLKPFKFPGCLLRSVFGAIQWKSGIRCEPEFKGCDWEGGMNVEPDSMTDSHIEWACQMHGNEATGISR